VTREFSQTLVPFPHQDTWSRNVQMDKHGLFTQCSVLHSSLMYKTKITITINRHSTTPVLKSLIIQVHTSVLNTYEYNDLMNIEAWNAHVTALCKQDNWWLHVVTSGDYHWRHSQKYHTNISPVLEGYRLTISWMLKKIISGKVHM
jgi:hypothetical protein